MGALAKVKQQKMPADQWRLHHAAQYELFWAIFDSVRSGIAINLPNAQGESALHVAAREGHADAAAMLLELGADRLLATMCVSY